MADPTSMTNSADIIRLGVDRQIISAEQGKALHGVAAELAGINTPPPLPTAGQVPSKPRPSLDTDENLRLVGGGNDLFVTVGVVLLLAGGLSAFAAIFTSSQVALWLVSIVAVWAIAEAVTRQRRMKLSSTVLAVAFVWAIGELVVQTLISQVGLRIPQNVLELLGMRAEISTAGLIFFGSLIAASIVYFWRFRVPILAASIALAITGLIFQYALLYVYDGVIRADIQISSTADFLDLTRNALIMPLICGLAIFAVGVAFDLHDRERETVWSDCAFWLHGLSAPLMVHPLFLLATGQTLVFGEIEGSQGAGVGLFVLVILFTFVALAIDRRSLLVPSLAYLGVLGIATLIEGTAEATGVPTFAIVLLAIGALVIMFGAGWQRIRWLIIRPMLPTSALNRLPPIKVSA
ncbi:MAG: hypothetical protein AAF737_07050 [Pseudomonadota bacterium]